MIFKILASKFVLKRSDLVKLIRLAAFLAS